MLAFQLVSPIRYIVAACLEKHIILAGILVFLVLYSPSRVFILHVTSASVYLSRYVAQGCMLKL